MFFGKNRAEAAGVRTRNPLGFFGMVCAVVVANLISLAIVLATPHVLADPRVAEALRPVLERLHLPQ